mgnify:CR=1 FL=1
MQQPHPPVWIPGGGSVETWQWCAERDYVYSYLSYFGYKLGQDTMTGFWREMDRLGKDRNPFRAGFLQFVGVAESRDEAMELYREPAEYFYGRSLHLDPRYVAPPGYTTEASIRQRARSQVAAAAGSGSSRPGGPGGIQSTMEGIVENGYVIVGSPDEVAEQLREVATELNVGQLMLLLQFGNMGRDLTRYNTELFAKKVAPQLRGLFEDEWENRWWPRPLAADAIAVPKEPGR